jgi:hypothetical protein
VKETCTEEVEFTSVVLPGVEILKLVVETEHVVLIDPKTGSAQTSSQTVNVFK